MKRHFTIGEISRLFNIGPDSLRYYERIGVIRPKRGENGYRYYSIKDIWRLNVIRDLRQLGFSMERIGQHLQNRSIDSTLHLLRQQRDAIDTEMQRLARQRENVEGRLASIQTAGARQEGIVCRERYPTRRCYEIAEGYDSDEEMDVLIQRLLRIDERRLFIIGNSHIGSRLAMDAVARGEYRAYTGVFIVAESGDTELPGGEYLSVSYRGDCGQNAVYIPQLLEYARANGLRLAGDILELLLVDIHTAEDMAQHVTELQVRIQ